MVALVGERAHAATAGICGGSGSLTTSRGEGPCEALDHHGEGSGSVVAAYGHSRGSVPHIPDDAGAGHQLPIVPVGLDPEGQRRWSTWCRRNVSARTSRARRARRATTPTPPTPRRVARTRRAARLQVRHSLKSQGKRQRHAEHGDGQNSRAVLALWEVRTRCGVVSCGVGASGKGVGSTAGYKGMTSARMPTIEDAWMSHVKGQDDDLPESEGGVVRLVLIDSGASLHIGPVHLLHRSVPGRMLMTATGEHLGYYGQASAQIGMVHRGKNRLRCGDSSFQAH